MDVLMAIAFIVFAIIGFIYSFSWTLNYLLENGLPDIKNDRPSLKDFYCYRIVFRHSTGLYRVEGCYYPFRVPIFCQWVSVHRDGDRGYWTEEFEDPKVAQEICDQLVEKSRLARRRLVVVSKTKA